MNLILCGLPGSGKTTTCSLLAERLGWAFLETDHELEKAYEQRTGEKASCRQIYKRVGDQEFRHLEQLILSSLKIKNHVIDLGGGTLTHAANAQIVKTLGFLIYLKIDRDVVFNRLMKKGMPSYLNAEQPYESFIALADERESIYHKYSDIIIEGTSLTPQEIVDKILDKI